MPTITIEDDAPPIVRILGNTLRRAAADSTLARRIDSMKGTVALRSTTDPQAATITFDEGTVSVRRGASPDADVTISADLNTLGRPGAPSPKVKGAAAHPRLALAVAKVLDPPVRGGWVGAAEEFWAWSDGQRGRPRALRVHCTDDDTWRTLGDDDGSGARGGVVELHAPAWVLTAIFRGSDHLGAAVVEGRVNLVASMPVLSELIGLVTRRMLGERW